MIESRLLLTGRDLKLLQKQLSVTGKVEAGLELWRTRHFPAKERQLAISSLGLVSHSRFKTSQGLLESVTKTCIRMDLVTVIN